MKKRVVVTGASGLIGSRFCHLLSERFDIIPLSSREFDITSQEKTRTLLTSFEFDSLVHLAAYTNVDEAETEQEKAFAINVEGTKNIVSELKHTQKQLLHVSTDFVFDGIHPPFDEKSKPHPLGYYAQTKYLAEKEVEKVGCIVRISYPYGPLSHVRPDFVQKILTLLQKNTTISMTIDAQMTPTYIDDIVTGLSTLINEEKRTGIVHLSGPDSFSPFDAGKTIANIFGFPAELIQPTTYDEYMKRRALRPRYGVIRSILPYSREFRTFVDGLQLIKKSL